LFSQILTRQTLIEHCKKTIMASLYDAAAILILQHCASEELITKLGVVYIHHKPESQGNKGNANKTDS